MLADLELVEAEILGSGGQPVNREVRVEESCYLQIISRLSESGLLRIYAVDITEQRWAEEALRQSETLYRTVVEQAAENIFLVDVGSKRILECDDAFCSSLGYDNEDLQDLTLYDLVAGDRESIDENIRRVVESGRYRVGERQSEEALEEVREAERSRIARDLHDDILQDIVYALQETQIMLAIAGDGRETELESIAEALRRSVEGLRGAIFELRLEGTLKQSFLVSLRYLVELNQRMSRRRYSINLSVEEGFHDEIAEDQRREVIRIVQEALNNVRRHAEPQNVWVRVGYGDETIRVEIADDGRGFVPGTFTGGVGQYSMRQRAEGLGGRLHVESAPGAGTTVRLELPHPPATSV